MDFSEKYYPNTYYMTITERFTRADGSSSYYSRMMGDGQFTTPFKNNRYNITKAELLEEVKHILSSVLNLEDFTIKETDYGWEFERFVKWLDDDGIEYELVTEGKHSDHELYIVDIFYIDADTHIFSKLD